MNKMIHKRIVCRDLGRIPQIPFSDRIMELPSVITKVNQYTKVNRYTKASRYTKVNRYT